MTVQRFSFFAKIFLCAALLSSGSGFLFGDDDAPASSSAPQAAALTPEQLDSLVSPIALYPDPLLSQIFVAATYPLEIVQAYQWLQQNSSLKGEDLSQAAAKQNWDPSVQALVAFPDLMKRLAQDATWTTHLGNAFLANQGNVMDAVQRMRLKAQEAGKLQSTPQEKVVATDESGQKVIEIEPADPNVIYVPEYNPVWIWGPAPDYYPYPYWSYPPVAPVGFWFYWGLPCRVSSFYVGWNGWGSWGWRPGWRNRTVVVNNTFIIRNHFSRDTGVRAPGTVPWHHDPVHRLGVAYPSHSLSERFRPQAHVAGAQPREIVRSHLTATQVQGQLHRAATRVRAVPGGPERIGNRQIPAASRNHSAFGGIEAGAAARRYSNRGYASLGRAGAHPAAHPSGVRGSRGGRGAVGGAHGGAPGGHAGGNFGDGGGHR